MQISESKESDTAGGCGKSSVKCCSSVQHSQEKHKRALTMHEGVCVCVVHMCTFLCAHGC